MQITKKSPNKLKCLIWVAIAVLLIGGGVFVYFEVTQDQSESSTEMVRVEPAPEAAVEDVPKFEPLSEIPSRIMIDKIGVDAAIESVGLTSDGLMDAPKTNHGVGWYHKSARAGEDNYAMLLDGHYGTETNPAVFHRLEELNIGDIIEVQGDGATILKYEVVETDQQYAEDVDMRKAMYPYSKGGQSLTIITCEGLFDAVNVSYDKRTVVYAERVS